MATASATDSSAGAAQASAGPRGAARQAGAHPRPAFLDVHLRAVAWVQQLPLALGLELGAALGALREMGLDDVVFRGLEAAREVPRQQPLHGDVRIGFEAKDLTAHANVRQHWASD